MQSTEIADKYIVCQLGVCSRQQERMLALYSSPIDTLITQSFIALGKVAQGSDVSYSGKKATLWIATMLEGFFRDTTPHQQHWANSVQKSPSNHLYVHDWLATLEC